jgi:hypothetical protein
MKYISIFLYTLVGAVSFLMAYKNLFAKAFLPFHEQASGTEWKDVDPSLQKLILFIMRISGMGFLTVALLVVVTVAFTFIESGWWMVFLPFIALVFCTGLFVFNYDLFRKTGAKTPWQGSLFAILALIAAAICSFL